MNRPYRYPWPAAAIGKEEMALLFAARETSPEPTTITRLIAEAIRAAYGRVAKQPEPQTLSATESYLRPAA
jgi:hypothetical protein